MKELFRLSFLVILFLVLETVPAGARDIRVGVYYFPGWNSSNPYWKDLKGEPGSKSPGKPWPDREPLLGFNYPEESVRVAEQHVEWASAYGIDFFAYDWYWDGKKPFLNHAVDNFMNARNRAKLKFCLLWANPSGVIANLGEFDAMVDFWLAHYLKDGQYLREDGKPVVEIFSPKQLNQDAQRFGMTTGQLLDRARKKALSAGLKGIYFVASTSAYDPYIKDLIPKNGYDATTAYNYHNADFGTEYTGQGPLAASYQELIAGYRAQWRSMQAKSALPYFVPVSAGWDSRPWGSDTPHDNCDSTPESFKQMLLAAREMVERYPKWTRKTVMICAWNEFAEGSYIEPTKKWQFRYLQAVKDVFGK